LAECHKAGKTPEVGLVFRIPNEERIIRSTKLAIEMRWQTPEGETISGRFSLRNTPRLEDEGPKQPVKPKPTTYEGEWRGPPSDDVHVEAIIVEKNEFPCKGSVKFVGKGVGIETPVIWEQKDGELYGTKDSQLVARVKLADGMLSGEITVTGSAQFFLGGAKGFTIAGFTKH
jgi:hypothetical protein